MKKKKPITADELLSALEADPEYRERQAAMEINLQMQTEVRIREEAPIIRDLNTVGVSVTSVWDLIKRKNYSAALPVLLEHLQRPYQRGIREGLARALAVPGSRFAWQTLLDLYRSESDPLVHEGLAIALSVSADDEVLDTVISLAFDPSNGGDRLHLIRALKRSKDPKALATLKKLRTDPVFQYEVEKYFRAQEKRKQRRQRAKADGERESKKNL